MLFDFDGTLTEPMSLNLSVVKKSVDCPVHAPLLEHIAQLASEEERTDALQVLDDFEYQAAARATPNSGAEELIADLRSRHVPLGIVTRNRRRSVLRALENFSHVTPSDFKVIISRDDRVEPKPNAAGILLAAERMDLRAEQILTVGDFIFDMEAGHRAGTSTAFLSNGRRLPEFERSPDYVVSRLCELTAIIQRLLPLPVGKLPNDLLKDFLGEFSLQDPSVLIRPGVGEDVSVVEVEEGVVVLTTDPITLASDQLAYYAITVNANDLATSGAVPRWLLTTLLFPAGSTAAQIHRLMQELQSVSHEMGISLCGGHTEITEAVNQPIVVVQLTGTAARDSLIDKRNMKEGDQILMTKAVALEGTSIIARDYPDALRHLGMLEEEIQRCRQFLLDPGISILQEACIAARHQGVSAMHDVTEGGVATALQELSVAGGHRLQVIVDGIPVLPETEKLCRMLDLSPLGLIASGSCLIVCQPEIDRKLMAEIRETGIEVSHIGEVLEAGSGIRALDREGRPARWPRFEVDEVSRALEKLGGRIGS